MANLCDIALWSLIILLLVISVPTTATENVAKPVKACHKGKCGNFRYDATLMLYPGLLHTNTELLQFKQFPTRNNTSLLTEGIFPEIAQQALQVKIDTGYCCPTLMDCITNWRMTNIHGVTRSIIHIPDAVPPRYQFIPDVSCMVPGMCPGTCFAEQSIITLLVMNYIQNTLQFDQFTVPAYCSCKNVLI